MLLSACKKEVEVIKIQEVEVEKKSSWTEVQDFSGNMKILLGLSKTVNGLYFQQPRGFGVVTTRQNRTVIDQFGYLFSSDIDIRVPLGPDYFVTYYDSLVAFTPNKAPVQSGATEFVYLKRLDPEAVRVQRNYFPTAKFGAINRNNYLLFGYETVRGTADGKLHFVLAQVTPSTDPYIPRPKVTPRLISIPFTGMGIYPSFPILITAIDDYFLADCGQEGLYKIKQDGSWKRVLTQPTGATCFYKWQNRLYILGSYMGYSTDDGDTWTFVGNTPSIFQFNTYHVVGDSLVGVYHGAGSNLIFTRKLTDTNFSVRLLKDDGLLRHNITGLESWGDTVYITTVGGMFKRPVSTFFESKPQ
ncbi:hypothetical protein [Hymenobacter metallicola]|uniref:Exo-alpha-sialidase n=1 Tax=Hymenobacter metallicola TaxID=2563114 RepID=A0A4Z0Q145_9BACT|nr:hypothetical protein [Hymenobacter metallicola]TGE23405.1 hypothetical protein E5K02_19615 [Hymenobacter metallicola]